MHDELHMEIGDLKDQIAELEKENKKYREALEFYADIGTWRGTKLNCQDFNTLESEMIETDGCTLNIGGVRARQALNK